MSPLILFGACDRHNLGDILLALVAWEEAGIREPDRLRVLAGLAERPPAHGNPHRVHAITDLAREWGDAPADLLHVGGELLTCDLFQAAVMLQTPGQAAECIARFAADPAAGLAWARASLGLRQEMAYLVPRALFRKPRHFGYRAVGGVEFDRLAPSQRAEVLARLAEADAVSVREATTRAHLAAVGIQADLEADPVSRVPQLFAPRIRAHAGAGEPAAVRAAFPHGYLAAQCAAEYGDDASLDLLAAHLDGLAAGARGLVLFRAGAAPWHDDLAVYRRLARRLGERRVRLFESLDVWDLCALLAHADRYCGSSLHGWILARAFGVETAPFPLPPRHGKLAAYHATWGDVRAARWRDTATQDLASPATPTRSLP